MMAYIFIIEGVSKIEGYAGVADCFKRIRACAPNTCRTDQ
jgi:hypothetical protein